ncbi:hypothetical protein LTS08_007502 [Lithohypha guttulata]|nr:hypothetical protein LTS08_007502 [Lithohypha guttulata]
MSQRQRAGRKRGSGRPRRSRSSRTRNELPLNVSASPTRLEATALSDFCLRQTQALPNIGSELTGIAQTSQQVRPAQVQIVDHSHDQKSNANSASNSGQAVPLTAFERPRVSMCLLNSGFPPGQEPVALEIKRSETLPLNANTQTTMNAEGCNHGAALILNRDFTSLHATADEATNNSNSQTTLICQGQLKCGRSLRCQGRSECTHRPDY